MVTLRYGSILELHIYIPTTGMTPDTEFLDRLLLATNGRMMLRTRCGLRGLGSGSTDIAPYARPAVSDSEHSAGVVS